MVDQLREHWIAYDSIPEWYISELSSLSIRDAAVRADAELGGIAREFGVIAGRLEPGRQIALQEVARAAQRHGWDDTLTVLAARLVSAESGFRNAFFGTDHHGTSNALGLAQTRPVALIDALGVEAGVAAYEELIRGGWLLGLRGGMAYLNLNFKRLKKYGLSTVIGSYYTGPSPEKASGTDGRAYWLRVESQHLTKKDLEALF